MKLEEALKKATPGPWTTGGRENREVFGPNGEDVGAAFVFGHPTSRTGEEVARANAVVMAAARQVLEGVEKLAESLENTPGRDPTGYWRAAHHDIARRLRELLPKAPAAPAHEEGR